MDLGALTAGFLTGLREGVEAALIVAIVLAYLARTGNLKEAPKVWFGAGAAILLSLVAGIVIFQSIGALPEPYEQLFEAATLLIAAAVVTWMLFWMRRQARSVRGELQAAVDRAIDNGSATALALLAFFAVIREGVETSLFLTGQAAAASADGGAVWVPMLMSPISTNSWTAWLSRPAAMNTSATPVQRKKVARLIRLEP